MGVHGSFYLGGQSAMSCISNCFVVELFMRLSQLFTLLSLLYLFLRMMVSVFHRFLIPLLGECIIGKVC